MAISYKNSGVDLQAYERTMGRLPALMQRTQTPRVMPLTGGFAGLFKLQGDGKNYRDPVLVSGTDGVGTKIKVAILAQKYDTVGIDLVGMCVNDCLCLGAEPLFFLDYVAMAKDDTELTTDLVKGVSDGCLEAGAALIGGETAIMPDLYAEGDFDMAGFCVGVVEQDQILDGRHVQNGDVLIGIESSGVHSNGFSLVRKILFDHCKLNIDSEISEFGKTVGEILLTPTRIYAAVVQSLLAKAREHIHGIAHITGGGLAENTGRMIPQGLQAVIHRDRYEVPQVFQWLQKSGDVEREEMYRVFNMGIGLVISVTAEQADEIQRIINSFGFRSHLIGEVRAGDQTSIYADA